MTAAGSSPGKTAPKLLNDFLHFDPITCDPKRNYLTHHTPPIGEGQQLGPQAGGCKHDYSLKPQQSITPPIDDRADSNSIYKVAVCCKKCRLHADIRIGYRHAVRACPNQQYPLHHFLRQTERDLTTETRIVYGWQCSAPECGAQLEIGYRMKRLQDDDVQLLTDLPRLKRRYEEMLGVDPTREGLRRATRTEPLSRLRKYISDGMGASGSLKVIQAHNKRFGEAFGVDGRDCAGLLQRLGFVPNAAEETSWKLPSPAALDDRLRADGTSQRELLEDVEKELVALMGKVSSESDLINPAAGEGWASAEKDVERLLASQNCKWITFAAARAGAVSI